MQATYRAASAAGLLLVLVLGLSMLSVPQKVHATGMEADAKCIAAWDYSCPCGVVCKKGGPPGGLNCPCSETTNGFGTSGVCVAALKCLAKNTAGLDGKGMSIGDLSQLMQMAKGLMDMVKGQGGGSGGGGSGVATPGTTPTLGGCASYYNVTTPSSDPCAVYMPPVSESLGSTTGSTSAGNDLISSLLGGGYVDTSSNSNTQTSSNTTTGTTETATTTNNTAGTTNTPTTVVATTTKTVIAPVPLNAGLSGDIQYSSSSVTVLVNNVDSKTNTQVAGFYGTGAAGQPQGTVSSMCSNRPWATNFLSYIIPATFFDSLCSLRGYKVGQTTVKAAAPQTVSTKQIVTVTKPAVKPATTTKAVATTTGPYVEPKADIWAVPASVPLGARTTVFWSAKGVTSCEETSPDGSFTQKTLSGGAATVPLSGATTYSISCLTPAGDHITNYVTVNLSTN